MRAVLSGFVDADGNARGRPVGVHWMEVGVCWWPMTSATQSGGQPQSATCLPVRINGAQVKSVQPVNLGLPQGCEVGSDSPPSDPSLAHTGDRWLLEEKPEEVGERMLDFLSGH